MHVDKWNATVCICPIVWEPSVRNYLYHVVHIESIALDPLPMPMSAPRFPLQQFKSIAINILYKLLEPKQSGYPEVAVN